MSRPFRWLRRFQAARLTTYLLALWRLIRHPRAPRSARWLALLVLGYALSPIDLVPDFIPVLGQLDDLILIPLGVALVIRLIPRDLWRECLASAEAAGAGLPRLWWGAALVVGVWLLMLMGLLWWLGDTLWQGGIGQP